MAKLKMDEAGHAVLEGGVPVYVMDDGKELAIDGPQVHATFGTIRKERDEAKSKVEQLEASLRRFGSGDEALEQAAKKLKLAANLDEKAIVEAGKIDDVIANRLKTHTEASAAEKAALESKVGELSSKLRTVLISSKFSKAQIAAGLYLTPDAIEAMFGPHFEVDGDSVVAFRDPGTKKDKIYSKKDPGKLADFDEALEVVVTAHPNFKKWKRPMAVSGGDAPGGDSVGAAGVDISTLPVEERLSRAFAVPKAT